MMKRGVALTIEASILLITMAIIAAYIVYLSLNATPHYTFYSKSCGEDAIAVLQKQLFANATQSVNGLLVKAARTVERVLINEGCRPYYYNITVYEYSDENNAWVKLDSIEGGYHALKRLSIPYTHGIVYVGLDSGDSFKMLYLDIRIKAFRRAG